MWLPLLHLDVRVVLAHAGTMHARGKPKRSLIAGQLTYLLWAMPYARTQLKTNLDIVLRRINNREEFLYRGLIWKHQRCQHNHSSCIEICQILYE